MLNVMKSRLAGKTLLQAVFFFLLVTQICFAQWVQTNGPFGGYIQCFAISGTSLFAGTLGGGVFLSTNNGTNWTAVDSGLTENSVTALAVKGTNLFAGTYEGVYLSTDNGTSWTPVNSGFPYPMWVTAFTVIGTNLFAGTYTGVYLSTDNGTSWNQVNSGLPYSYPTKVTAFAVIGTNLFAGIQSAEVSGVFLSTNNGTSWTAVNSGLTDPYVNAFALSGTNLFAGTQDGGVFLSTNKGTSWTAVNSGLTNLSVLSLVVKDMNLFAGTFGGVFLSTDNGTSWSLVNTDLPQNDHVLCFAVNGADLYAGTDCAGVFCNWTPVNTGLTANPVTNIGVNGSILFAATSPYGMYRSDNNGESWDEIVTGLPNTYVSCFASIGTSVFAGTHSQGVLRSTDSGINWIQTGLMNEFILALAVSGTSLICGTADSGVFVSTDNGTGWTSANEGLTNLYVSALAVSGTELIAATNGGIFRSNNNGTSWARVDTLGYGPLAVSSLKVSVGNLFAVDTHVHGYCPFSNRDRSNVSPTSVWNPTTADPAEGKTNGLFVSPDNGTNWAYLAFNCSGLTALGVSGTNLFAGFCYWYPIGVLLSTDNGINWTAVNTGFYPIPDVLSFAVSGTNLFVGTFGSGIWRRPLSEIIPVELRSFTATTNGKEVILNWSTATELNNLGFEIQRSTEGKEFLTVGFVNGHGTTTEQQNYSFADRNLDDGKYYYRLKQVDYDGSYEYSDVVEVDFRAFNSYLLIQCYPNPFNPTTTIGFGIQNKSNVRITILNAIGEEVAIVLNEEKEPGFHQVEFNAIGLPSGVYFYQLKSGEFIQTKKMILLK